MFLVYIRLTSEQSAVLVRDLAIITLALVFTGNLAVITLTLVFTGNLAATRNLAIITISITFVNIDHLAVLTLVAPQVPKHVFVLNVRPWHEIIALVGVFLVGAPRIGDSDGCGCHHIANLRPFNVLIVPKMRPLPRWDPSLPSLPSLPFRPRSLFLALSVDYAHPDRGGKLPSVHEHHVPLDANLRLQQLRTDLRRRQPRRIRRCACGRRVPTLQYRERRKHLTNVRMIRIVCRPVDLRAAPRKHHVALEPARHRHHLVFILSLTESRGRPALRVRFEAARTEEAVAADLVMLLCPGEHVRAQRRHHAHE